MLLKQKQNNCSAELEPLLFILCHITKEYFNKVK